MHPKSFVSNFWGAVHTVNPGREGVLVDARACIPTSLDGKFEFRAGSPIFVNAGAVKRRADVFAQ